MIKRSLLALVAIVSTIFLVSAFAAGDYSAEISTAHAHARLATKTKDLNLLHVHLKHAINCLVGPDGKEFFAETTNPCEHSGNGAIPDMGDASPQVLAKLKMAVTAASEGVKSNQYEPAHVAARKAAALLEQAGKMK